MTLLRQPIRIRWSIFGFMFSFALLSFVQRTSVAVAADTLMPSLHLSQFQIGLLNAAFLMTYTLMQVPSGVLGQRFGARIVFFLVGLIGVLATLATPLMPFVLAGTGLFVALLLAQAVLGFSQAPVFPVFAGVVEAWFPARRWALANGLQSAGMLVGGAVTPLLIVSLTQSVGWQMALISVALPVVVITIGWAWYGRNHPRQHPSVTSQELAELPEASDTVAPPMTLRRLGRIVSDRNVLLLTFSYLCINYSFYLLTYWSYLYLVQVRHFQGIESGFVGMVPWIGAAIGAISGGVLADRFAIKLGPRWGYRLVPLIALPFVGVLMLVTVELNSAYGAVLSMAAAFFAVEINEGAYWAATMNIARSDTAAATGVLNTGGNLGGIICQPIVALFSAAGAWNLAFGTGTLFALLAAAAWIWVDAERQAAV